MDAPALMVVIAAGLRDQGPMIRMVSTPDGTTILDSLGEPILRSTDQGDTWERVPERKPFVHHLIDLKTTTPMGFAICKMCGGWFTAEQWAAWRCEGPRP